MAEFKDATLWMKLAFLLAVLGFVQDLFGFGYGMGQVHATNGIEACFIIGFLCFLAAFFLILCFIYFDEANGNKIVHICFIVFILIAGLITIIGIASWGGRYDGRAGDTPAFSTTVGCCSCLCAILSGIFAILEIVGVKV